MLPKTFVIVASVTSVGSGPDLMALGLCDEIRRRSREMHLVEDRVLGSSEVSSQLAQMDASLPRALVLVGRLERIETAASRWLEQHPDLVVVMVPIGEDTVLIQARDTRLEQVVDAIQDLVEKGGPGRGDRTVQFELPAPANETGTGSVLTTPAESEAEAARDEAVLLLDADDVLAGGQSPALPPPRPLLEAATDWAHVVLRKSAGRLFGDNGSGVEMMRVQVVDWLDERGPRTPLSRDDDDIAEAHETMAEALHEALIAPLNGEPLAVLCREIELDPLEFRIVVLALAPELDPRYQHWISLLMMDDPGRRAGTLALYAELIGVSSEVIVNLVRSGRLARWRVFEGSTGVLPGGDAPLRLDAPLRAWLLGAASGLEQADPVLRRILRPAPWPGATLVEDQARARELIAALGVDGWSVLTDDGGPANWRALVEAGAGVCERPLLRANLAGAAALDPLESAEAGARLARLALLTGRPLVLDAAEAEAGHPQDEALGALLEALGNVTGAIITTDPARIVRLLGVREYRLEKDVPGASARLAALVSAAAATGAQFTAESAESLANLYPLRIDGLEQAMRLALSRPAAGEDAKRARFITACKEVSAEGATGLAQRIEPIFDLDDVVLPPDRKAQLLEIVDNVRFAPKVLEGWKFRDQLPYGLGVTALFFGPSGCGKTMASMAVAKRLGVQLLRLDLSRVVSKYIGETEKNIDAVFQEAQLSGAGLLIDEADGLLSRRGEVKDAHDRYANLEVAYLLQRIEAFEGLCLCTSNLRQNLDTAFVRRLRFIVEFPRPDAAAREEIWRRCLPEDSHVLDDAAFRLLGRRVELTGGSIRQITLRGAFLAAAAGERIGPAHIAHAARAEFAKLGLPPAELDAVERLAA